MKKMLILKATGKPVKIGDIIEFRYSKTQKDGTVVNGIQKQVLTAERAERLLKRGILSVQTFGQPSSYEGVPSHVGYYANKFVGKLLGPCPNHYTILATSDVVNRMLQFCPIAITCGILREIALELDNRHSDVIKDSNEIWVISTLNGKPYQVDKSSIKNYRNFAAFRSLEDALFAKRVLGDFHKLCFNGRKQENQECNNN